MKKKNCDWNEFLKIIQNFNITFYPKENNDKTNLNNKEIIKVDIDKNTNKNNDGSSKKGMSQINTEENKRSAIPNNINKVSNKTYEEQKSNHCKIINTILLFFITKFIINKTRTTKLCSIFYFCQHYKVMFNFLFLSG